jgi:hypothetical protein
MGDDCGAKKTPLLVMPEKLDAHLVIVDHILCEPIVLVMGRSTFGRCPVSLSGVTKMMKKVFLAGTGFVLGVAASSSALAQYSLGVNTNLNPNPAYMRPAAPPPAPARSAPQMSPSSRNVDLRPLPPRPMIERPAPPAPAPSPAPRLNIQAQPTQGPGPTTLEGELRVTPKTSLTGTLSGNPPLPTDQSSPSLEGGTVGVSRKTP